ncbi:purple acid phosphatase 15-like protein [Tanacetum coccineum]
MGPQVASVALYGSKGDDDNLLLLFFVSRGSQTSVMARQPQCLYFFRAYFIDIRSVARQPYRIVIAAMAFVWYAYAVASAYTCDGVHFLFGDLLELLHQKVTGLVSERAFYANGAFKVLASTYLHVKDEELEVFEVIKEILTEVKVTKEEFHGTKARNTLQVHAYGRSNGVYNYTLDPCSPVYITMGDGGNRENMVVKHAESTIPDSFMGGFCAYNFTSGPTKGGFC